MTTCKPVHLLLIAILIAVSCESVSAASNVLVMHGPDAPQIERDAAHQIRTQFERLFLDVNVTVDSATADDADTTVLIGSPATNPEIATRFTDWPQLTDQGLTIIAKPDQRLYAVGGGSPAATMWAASELGYRLGVRYLPRADLYPQQKKPFQLDGTACVMEPQFKSRTWAPANGSAIGPDSWSAAEYKPFLQQLAKMKYNRLMISIAPWQPFLQYEFGGVRKSTAAHWSGETYPLDGDTVGKKAFTTESVFENSDFAGCTTPDQHHAAGQKHLQQIIDAAHQLGMTVGLSLSSAEFPVEFQNVLPGSQVVPDSRNLVITAAGDEGWNDPALKQLVIAKVRACLQTYPALDTLYLSLPEFPNAGDHAENALQQLQKHGLSSEVTLQELFRNARQRKTTVTGEEAEQTVRSNLLGLSLLRALLMDGDLLKRADGKKVELMITGVDPAVSPYLHQVLPDGAGVLHTIDATAGRVSDNSLLIDQVPAGKAKHQLRMTVADDNAGVLPQSALQSISELTAQIRQQNWDGFTASFRVPAELDASLYFLARAAWQKDLTAEQAVRELWTTATGNESAADRLWKAWQHLETATRLIDQHQPGFAFTAPNMLLKNSTSDPLPEWWAAALEAYTQYMTELYRAHGAIEGDARPVLFYYAKRGEFALEYLASVKAVREARLAVEAGDIDKAMEHFETALEQTYNSINTLSDVALDQSDRGLVAVLNAYSWRPLQAEVQRVEDSE